MESIRPGFFMAYLEIVPWNCWLQTLTKTMDFRVFFQVNGWGGVFVSKKNRPLRRGSASLLLSR